MGILPILVLGEENGSVQFAYVVVEGTRTHQLAFGSQGIGYLGSEISHLHGVLEGAGSLFGQTAEHFVVGVGEFHQCYHGGELEKPFEGEKQKVGDE